MFKISKGIRIEVPAEHKSIVVSYSANGRLGSYGDVQPWPHVTHEGNSIELDVVEAASSFTAEKYYFQNKVRSGEASIYDPETKERLTFSFVPELVPYLAVWANYGGFQEGYNLALEPATGFLDALDESMRRANTSTVELLSSYEWSLRVRMGSSD